ncbi:hypothetical protein [Novosphingobium sp. 9U]|uniref:hypothetical protein n=1 Tax=Novosphingobium sp. 9U TaxID=2653158 RepID=UPI001F23F296|nr:hypothetical protein [Novosphingobium sp. 9U]
MVLTISVASLAAEPKKADEAVKTADKAGDAGEKMMCKRFLETGSLVKGHRVCKTKRDWEREREAIRASTSSSGSCASQGLSGGC